MDKVFMARAIQLSLENVSSGRGGPFGSVIVKEGVVVAEAANQVTATNDPTAHAEVLAIRQACQKLRYFELRAVISIPPANRALCAWAQSTGPDWQSLLWQSRSGRCENRL